MRQRSTHLLVLVVAMLMLLAGGTATRAEPHDGFTGNWTPASAVEEEQIAGVLRDTMRARAIAARTFDVSGIRANVVDDPSVPLTARQRGNLARLGVALDTAGQLTAELAFFSRWMMGDEAFQRVQQARLGGREADPADALLAMPRRSDPIYELPLTVHGTRISGSRAYLEAETDAIFYRVTLVKRGERWFIAGEDNTSKL